MSVPEKFTGFQVHGPETWLEFHKNEFQPKPFGDYDVDIKIECCGVCASDVHTISGGWGKQHYPLAVGHGRAGPADIPSLSLFPGGNADETQRSSGGPSAWDRR
jgi:alcohol dehydrogenase (NADP+)